MPPPPMPDADIGFTPLGDLSSDMPYPQLRIQIQDKSQTDQRGAALHPHAPLSAYAALGQLTKQMSSATVNAMEVMWADDPPLVSPAGESDVGSAVSKGAILPRLASEKDRSREDKRLWEGVSVTTTTRDNTTSNTANGSGGGGGGTMRDKSGDRSTPTHPSRTFRDANPALFDSFDTIVTAFRRTSEAHHARGLHIPREQSETDTLFTFAQYENQSQATMPHPSTGRRLHTQRSANKSDNAMPVSPAEVENSTSSHWSPFKVVAMEEVEGLSLFDDLADTNESMASDLVAVRSERSAQLGTSPSLTSVSSPLLGDRGMRRQFNNALSLAPHPPPPVTPRGRGSSTTLAVPGSASPPQQPLIPQPPSQPPPVAQRTPPRERLAQPRAAPPRMKAQASRSFRIHIPTLAEARKHNSSFDRRLEDWDVDTPPATPVSPCARSPLANVPSRDALVKDDLEAMTHRGEQMDVRSYRFLRGVHTTQDRAYTICQLKSSARAQLKYTPRRVEDVKELQRKIYRWSAGLTASAFVSGEWAARGLAAAASGGNTPQEYVYQRGACCSMITGCLGVGPMEGLLHIFHVINKPVRVITMLEDSLPPILLQLFAERGHSQLQINVADGYNANLAKNLHACYDYFMVGVARSEFTYVHCVGGRNRSACMAVALLMLCYRIPCSAAIELVQKTRCCHILTNDRFRWELMVLSDLLVDMDRQDLEAARASSPLTSG